MKDIFVRKKNSNIFENKNKLCYEKNILFLRCQSVIRKFSQILFIILIFENNRIVVVIITVVVVYDVAIGDG